MIKRINITIDEELLNRIDSYSKKRYLSRSGLISLALSTYLDTVDSVSEVKGQTKRSGQAGSRSGTPQGNP